MSFKKNIFLLIFTVFTCLCAESETTLNWKTGDPSLRHFRVFEEASFANLSKGGISGSSQFSVKDLKKMMKIIKKGGVQPGDVTILDLRMESHGFANGIPVHWSRKNNDSNLGKSLDEILMDEKTKLDELLKSTEGNIRVFVVATEQQAANQVGMNYGRLPTLDHSHPDDWVVEEFLSILKTHPEARLHVHCQAGRGRTTTFLSMYDMVYHAKEVSFDDILERQRQLDGSDLKKHIKHPDSDPYRQKLYKNRFKFLQNFYHFCKEKDPLKDSWSFFKSDTGLLSDES